MLNATQRDLHISRERKMVNDNIDSLSTFARQQLASRERAAVAKEEGAKLQARRAELQTEAALLRAKATIASEARAALTDAHARRLDGDQHVTDKLLTKLENEAESAQKIAERAVPKIEACARAIAGVDVALADVSRRLAKAAEEVKQSGLLALQQQVANSAKVLRARVQTFLEDELARHLSLINASAAIAQEAGASPAALGLHPVPAGRVQELICGAYPGNDQAAWIFDIGAHIDADTAKGLPMMRALLSVDPMPPGAFKP